MPEWLTSTEYLGIRIAIGAALLAALLVYDVLRRGRAAKRPAEYLFLVMAAAMAAAYGVINDQVTVTISWEYFFLGKELYQTMGVATPPDPTALRWEAVRIGIMGTWAVGLLAGAMVLLANNLRRCLPQLPTRRLYAMMVFPLAAAAGMAAMLGVAGYYGLLSSTQIPSTWRPERFMAVDGIHVGGYIGGAFGTLLAVWQVVRLRRAMALRQSRGVAPVANASSTRQPTEDSDS